MAMQFLPIFKAVAPYLAQIATAAIPSFTDKTEAAKSEQLLSRQIEELQTAATQNSQSIHILAEKMQLAIEGMEAAALAAKQQAQAYKAMLYGALLLSTFSSAACVYLLVR